MASVDRILMRSPDQVMGYGPRGLALFSGLYKPNKKFILPLAANITDEKLEMSSFENVKIITFDIETFVYSTGRVVPYAVG